MSADQTPNAAARNPALTGAAVSMLPPGRFPARIPLEGAGVRLEPVDPRQHADALYAASHEREGVAQLWTWMPYGPFADRHVFRAWTRDCACAPDPVFFAIRPLEAGQPAGMASYLNIRPRDGVIEIGHIWFGPTLQRTPAATEAMFLLMRHAFEQLGCRRLEWKCDAQNTRSRAAAARLGFRFEGFFYRHLIVKGRNRDTAWFSIIDEEWPSRREALERWLEPVNFDTGGGQRRSLRELRD